MNCGPLPRALHSGVPIPKGRNELGYVCAATQGTRMSLLK